MRLQPGRCPMWCGPEAVSKRNLALISLTWYRTLYFLLLAEEEVPDTAGHILHGGVPDDHWSCHGEQTFFIRVPGLWHGWKLLSLGSSPLYPGLWVPSHWGTLQPDLSTLLNFHVDVRIRAQSYGERRQLTPLADILLGGLQPQDYIVWERETQGNWEWEGLISIFYYTRKQRYQ